MIESRPQEVGDYVGDVIRAINVPVDWPFDPREYATIERVIRRYGHFSGSALSALSHQEPAWVGRQDGDIIPYSAAPDMQVIRELRSAPPL